MNNLDIFQIFKFAWQNVKGFKLLHMLYLSFIGLYIYILYLVCMAVLIAIGYTINANNLLSSEQITSFHNIILNNRDLIRSLISVLITWPFFFFPMMIRLIMQAIARNECAMTTDKQLILEHYIQTNNNKKMIEMPKPPSSSSSFKKLGYFTKIINADVKSIFLSRQWLKAGVISLVPSILLNLAVLCAAATFVYVKYFVLYWSDIYLLNTAILLAIAVTGLYFSIFFFISFLLAPMIFWIENTTIWDALVQSYRTMKSHRLQLLGSLFLLYLAIALIFLLPFIFAVILMLTQHLLLGIFLAIAISLLIFWVSPWTYLVLAMLYTQLRGENALSHSRDDLHPIT